MPTICYLAKNFRPPALALVDKANEIIEDYAEQGFQLTLRQLYYQFVQQNILPNNEKSYGMIGSVVNDARLAGLIDWEAIEDRTRHVRENAHWGAPSEIVRACANQFAIDKWGSQKRRVIVLIEKDALVGVIEPVCQALDTPCLSCRGYTSQTEMWKLGQRLGGWIADEQFPVVLHLGDHDPSGIDMSRDIRDRLALFLNDEGGLDAFDFLRLALNRDQIDHYKPPPNPAKITDSRCKSYIAAHGEESWELDALEPKVLAKLVELSILRHRERKPWAAALAEEAEHKKTLVNLTEVAARVEQRVLATKKAAKEPEDGKPKRAGKRKKKGRPQG
jgi:hypothetical protein